jgi:hypothetical protein
MVGFTLVSRSYYYLRVDEVPAPRSRPTTNASGRGTIRQSLVGHLFRLVLAILPHVTTVGSLP